jgi:hypothetical protein
MNHAAFLNWFQDDDFDNMSWGSVVDISSYGERLVSPLFHRETFRPLGHIMYHVLGKTARFNYVWYEIWLLAGHLINVVLVWLLLRKLGFEEVPTAAGAVFFAFHQACFFAYWRPMFVFDVYMTTFCLAAILAYLADRWIVSFAFFWAAYRTKELAIMLPVVLLGCDILLDPRRFIAQKRWLRLAPFFAVSASFGLQAIYANRVTNDTYTIRLTPATVWECLKFYSSKFLFPYSALGLLLVPAFFRRDRRAWLGVLAFWAFLFPMLTFPDRRVPVYLYLPLTGAAAVVAVLVAHPRARKPALAALGVWLAICSVALLRFERTELQDSADRRMAARELQSSVIQHRDTRYYVYQGLPAGFAPWGITGALSAYTQSIWGKRPDLQLASADEIKPEEFARRIPSALFTWNEKTRRASILHHTEDWQDWPYLPVQRPEIPLWQLGAGFSPTVEGDFRWILSHAEAHVSRPADARFFELVVNADDLVARKEKCVISVKLGGERLEPRTITSLEPQRFRWDLRPSTEPMSSVQVSIDVDGWFQAGSDQRQLAVKVLGLGFQ